MCNSFNQLGGGSKVYHAEGSWLDDENNVISDNCAVIFTALPINKWYTCIPELQRLIRDEIQTKLLQKCVFLRVDNQTYGEPLNLLGKEIEEFPSDNTERSVDTACFTLMRNYEGESG